MENENRNWQWKTFIKYMLIFIIFPPAFLLLPFFKKKEVEKIKNNGGQIK